METWYTGDPEDGREDPAIFTMEFPGDAEMFLDHRDHPGDFEYHKGYQPERYERALYELMNPKSPLEDHRGENSL